MKEWFLKALNFFGISGIGWIIDICIYTFLNKVCGLYITYANIISSFVSVTFVFVISTRKLFVNNGNIDIRIKYFIYILYQVLLISFVSYFMPSICNLLSVINIKLIIDNISIITKIIVTPFTMIINFIVMNNLIEKL